jgi:glycosyltransferase involved in cell wall biosynthesis
MKKRNITIVMPTAQLTGGSEEAFRQLLSGEGNYGIVYDVIFLEEGPLIQWVEDLGIRWLLTESGRLRQAFRWLRTVRNIRKHIERVNSDFVLGWILKSHLYGGVAAYQAGVPCGWFQLGLPQSGVLDYLASKIPSKVTFACSDYVAELQKKAVPNARVVSIPLGVDANRFAQVSSLSREECRKLLGLPTSRPVVGTVGRLQHWKGMHLLIEAVALVADKNPDICCIIVGGPFQSEPGYEKSLHHLVATLGLEGQVIFAGEQRNIPHWVRSFDIFVHASECEPFGIVVIEALATGTPVISFAPSGVASILRTLPTCVVLDSRDSKVLAEGVASLLRNESINRNDLIVASNRYSDAAFKDRMESAILSTLNDE